MNHYSVARIETAKQQCLKGEHWKKPEPQQRAVLNWTDDDEKKLVAIFNTFDIKKNGTPTHAALNRAIDAVQFSGGKHQDLSGSKEIQQVELHDGSIRVTDHRLPPTTNW